MLHAVNTQHGLQRIGPSAIARLGIKRLDDSGHILPWQNLLHAGEENLFSGLTALSAEFTIGEGELMAHDVPLGCAPDEYDDLISGTCSHLPKNQLVYRLNGFITKSGSTPISKTLEDYLKSGDYSSIENEFLRAVENIQTDPHASVTAACAIIESALKCYIEKFDLPMSQKLNVAPLWAAVQPSLNLNADATLADDQHKILKGISSIIDGIGAFRSHIGSAHGRGQNPPQIVVAEARLAVNASHTLVVFIMDVIHANKI